MVNSSNEDQLMEAPSVSGSTAGSGHNPDIREDSVRQARDTPCDASAHAHKAVTPASIRDSGWNPRFVAYANARGTTAQALWELGGWSVDFMAWNTAQLREWRQLRNLGDRPLTLPQHDDYTSWLTRRHQTKVAA